MLAALSGNNLFKEFQVSQTNLVVDGNGQPIEFVSYESLGSEMRISIRRENQIRNRMIDIAEKLTAFFQSLDAPTSTCIGFYLHIRQMS